MPRDRRTYEEVYGARAEEERQKRSLGRLRAVVPTGKRGRPPHTFTEETKALVRKQFIPSEEGEQCEICQRRFSQLCKDHDHATGAYRGMLCQKCNIALGGIEDSIESLKSAIVYLQKYNTMHAESPHTVRRVPLYMRKKR